MSKLDIKRAEAYLTTAGWTFESVSASGETKWRDPLADAKSYHKEKILPNGEPLIVDGVPVRQLVLPAVCIPLSLDDALERQRDRDRAAGKTPPDLREPPSDTGKGKTSKRGRKLDSDLAEDKRIYDGWKASGYKKMEEYATKIGCREYDVKLAVDRHKKRLQKKKEK